MAFEKLKKKDSPKRTEKPNNKDYEYSEDHTLKST